MGQRNLENGTNYGKGVVWLEFSFATNGASNPVITGASSTLRGAVGGGVDIVSITYAATGKYTIVTKDPYRYVQAKSCDLEDIASPDGAYASIGAVSGEGSTSGLTVQVATFNAGGTLTQYTTRRISVFLALKNSTVGQ